MNSKTILQNPEAAILDTWGSLDNCPSRAEILQLAEEITALKGAIKNAKDRKGELSGQFKQAKDHPKRFEQLKQDMAAVSAEVAELEKQRKVLEKSLRDHFQADRAQQAPEFPERFRARSEAGPKLQQVQVNYASAKDAAAWDDYVKARPDASLYHLYAWRQVIEDSFGHDCYYYAAQDRDGTVVGVLPVVNLSSRLFGNYAVSMPFFNYGGPLADSAPVRNALFEAARRDAAQRNWQHIEYRCCEKGLGLPSSQRKVSMILRLPESPQALDDSLRAKVRAQIKQADRHEPEVRFGGAELLDDYYQVFARNMRDLGTPVYGKEFFERMLQALPEHCTLVSVRLNGEPAAAAFLAGFKDMLEIPWASCLREFNDYNVNMWMYRQILGFAIDKGYGYFDFGRSTMGAGTYHFKKQWGAKPLQHHWYYQLNSSAAANDEDEAIPELNPDNPKYRLAIAAWKRLPLVVANTLGPRIVKNLP